ncbi:heptaprenylglyceryl phosphate synthase [Paenibacillus sp. GCM10012307]|uniref:Heptaprenylglyceryl phosphate synthase n=1 Tax=Paenibacillus roseus TaxID=2798579 RepID=A0A934IZ90_9BACL|nr:heptaprenylglyceryl phosphate synthase [Paenibacillus roseus]MBJ6361966.1 heptaprenylglyceryl phosphate synthase [Paenibacillus roseus]
MIEPIFASWKHVFKLDPDREINDEALDAVCMSGTDAIMVGGSSGVTFDNTVDLLSRIRRYEVPCALEVTSEEAAVPGFDYYLIPMVLNSRDPQWLVGRQVEAIRQFGSYIPWENTFAEGYIILNADAEAARRSDADARLDDLSVLAYVRLADRLMRMPIVYLEYSGRFGNMGLVRRARSLLTQGRLFYGGGIDSAEKAGEAAAAADTVIVGNIIYSDLAAALKTVQAVKQREN